MDQEKSFDCLNFVSLFVDFGQNEQQLTHSRQMELFLNDSIDSKIVKIVAIFLRNTNQVNKLKEIQIKSVRSKDELPPNILKKNPNGELPFLVIKGGDEKVIVGQKAIVDHLLSSDSSISSLLIPNKDEVCTYYITNILLNLFSILF